MLLLSRPILAMKDLVEAVDVEDQGQAIAWRHCLAAAWLWRRRVLLWLGAFKILLGMVACMRGGCGGSGGHGLRGGYGVGGFVVAGIAVGVVVADADWAEEGFTAIGVGDNWSWQRGMWRISQADLARGAAAAEPRL